MEGLTRLSARRTCTEPHTPRKSSEEVRRSGWYPPALVEEYAQNWIAAILQGGQLDGPVIEPYPALPLFPGEVSTIEGLLPSISLPASWRQAVKGGGQVLRHSGVPGRSARDSNAVEGR